MTLNEFIKVLQKLQDKGCGDYEVCSKDKEYYGEFVYDSFSIKADEISKYDETKQICI